MATTESPFSMSSILPNLMEYQLQVLFRKDKGEIMLFVVGSHALNRDRPDHHWLRSCRIAVAHHMQIGQDEPVSNDDSAALTIIRLNHHDAVVIQGLRSAPS